MNLVLPKEFGFTSTCKMTMEAVACADETQDLVIDFSRLGYSYPLAMLIAGRAIRHLVKTRKGKSLKTSALGVSDKNPAHTYLEWLGFFDFIGLKNRTRIGTAPGNSNYIPIREIKRDQVWVKGGDSKKMYGEILACSEDLAIVLAPKFEDYEVRRALTYALKETIRNVFEHSNADCCFVSAQRWNNGKVEVAVVDEGMGIRASLSEAFQLDSDLNALEMAIKPGASRTFGAKQNEHDNSGFGLFVLSEVGRNFGRFAVGSGDAALSIRASEKRRVDQAYFMGTFIGLKLDSMPKDFHGVLDDIVASGEQEAEIVGLNRKASASSKGLSLNKAAT